MQCLYDRHCTAWRDILESNNRLKYVSRHSAAAIWMCHQHVFDSSWGEEERGLMAGLFTLHLAWVSMSEVRALAQPL